MELLLGIPADMYQVWEIGPTAEESLPSGHCMLYEP